MKTKSQKKVLKLICYQNNCINFEQDFRVDTSL